MSSIVRTYTQSHIPFVHLYAPAICSLLHLTPLQYSLPRALGMRVTLEFMLVLKSSRSDIVLNELLSMHRSAFDLNSLFRPSAQFATLGELLADKGLSCVQL